MYVLNFFISETWKIWQIYRYPRQVIFEISFQELICEILKKVIWQAAARTLDVVQNSNDRLRKPPGERGYCQMNNQPRSRRVD